MKKAEPDAGFDGRCPYGIDIIRKSRGHKPPCEKVRRAEFPSRLQDSSFLEGVDGCSGVGNALRVNRIPECKAVRNFLRSIELSLLRAPVVFCVPRQVWHIPEASSLDYRDYHSLEDRGLTSSLERVVPSLKGRLLLHQRTGLMHARSACARTRRRNRFLAVGRSSHLLFFAVMLIVTRLLVQSFSFVEL